MVRLICSNWLIVVALALSLWGCQPSTVPEKSVPAPSEELGFTQFCRDHPGIGTCP